LQEKRKKRKEKWHKPEENAKVVDVTCGKIVVRGGKIQGGHNGAGLEPVNHGRRG